ncbi:hypothetical protein N7468_005355 [Penicillium chermesinum]|uniref:Uncharacterized protein n=1 Tax=Penicillium chermesinum TaxID=63820 RepID=A0A9W9NYX4_9EURO|nr:uncharacterized protein N7468_005355 [Penicillium chermesinum]KAJ5232399.1 hypothetical protein N7468_005355 [Penicillium chermesinum]KAJ6172056.1 hypothetical protein N7470_001123 [Penicillium chermesinum]
MAPREKSLKRGPATAEADAQDQKKPRRSQRISGQPQETPIDHEYLPTPMTHARSTATDIRQEVTATPPESPSRTHHASSPNVDFSQAISSPPDEDAEGVWGYLISLDDKVSGAFVLKKRNDCESQDASKERDGKRSRKSTNGRAPGGYLIGRHPECDLIIESPTVSNRHFLLFEEKRKGDMVAILEDLSSNGTFVNDAIVGRNKHRELEDGDEVSILDEARFVFRYPRTRNTNRFRQQYQIQRQLGKGHFATVYLCVEGSTGKQFAVKVFEKRPGDSQKSQSETLQQEIALLKSVNHPNLLCLKDTFDENDGAYLIMELAPEGELFNLIVSKSKLSEPEARHVFRQLFEGLKYLHDRGIVHRDIKPENILVADKKLSVKLGDFGLAKIIGEDSFTTTLCGTPSYVAPEILQDTRKRRYTKAVDVWSLGVVLYICLCGFPPFSDELWSREQPYTLAQQIKMGQFNYPSPYWDSVGDPALDLIDRMLTVDVEKRITVDECLEHPWLTEKYPSVTDSLDGMTGAMGNLDFSKRKVERERTLLSSINDTGFSEHAAGNRTPVKVYHKNDAGKRVHNRPAKDQKREPSPDSNSGPKDFVNLGQRGDPALYD